MSRFARFTDPDLVLRRIEMILIMLGIDSLA